MKVMKVAIIELMIICVVFTGSTRAVEITPSNVFLPASPGETLSFDFVISDPMGTSAQSFQATINVSGPGVLTFDGALSEAVDAETDYWVFGNSAGVTALDVGGDSYQFGDGPDDGVAQALAVDDIMARYAFTWDGTPGDYTFTLDFDTLNSFVLNESFVSEQLEFSPGQHTPSGQGGFVLQVIPEPTTLMLFALGGMFLLKKRKI